MFKKKKNNQPLVVEDHEAATQNVIDVLNMAENYNDEDDYTYNGEHVELSDSGPQPTSQGQTFARTEKEELTEEQKQIKKYNQVFKKDKKGRSSKGVINMPDDVTEDFVIVEDSKQGVKKLLSALKFLLIMIVILFFVALTYFCVIFRVSDGIIRGTDYYIGGYSIVSRYHNANISELHPGDKILRESDDTKLSPMVIKNNLLTYKYRNGYVLICEDSQGKEVAVETPDVEYIYKEWWLIEFNQCVRRFAL